MIQVIPIFTFGIGLILKRKGKFIIRVFLPEIIINIKLSGQIYLITNVASNVRWYSSCDCYQRT